MNINVIGYIINTFNDKKNILWQFIFRHKNYPLSLQKQK